MPTEKKKVTRKLSAILSADVKGYSVLMADDEVHTIETLKAHRHIISDLVSRHSGRVVDSPGDNILAEFRSSVDAVNCAVKIQKRLEQENLKYADDKKVQFRIGVNIGDVIQDGDRIYGNGVNVAARIEGLADPGGVCISRNVYNHVGNKLSLGYEYLGEHTVKNIKKPVRAYKLLMADEDAGKLIGDLPKSVAKKWIYATAVLAIIVITAVVWQVYQKMAKPEFEPARVEEMAFPLPEIPSIAVLPFVNMSGDSSKEYFSDGITEQIITSLSKVPRVFVISRTSTFSYKGKPVKVQQVAEDLGIRYVLEGSVQQSGDKIRITAQLIDALTGRHIWAERYERIYKDLFELQDEITLKILSEMQIKLTAGERYRLKLNKYPNLEVYEKLMEGTTYLRAFNKESNETARRLAQEAIELDPEFYSGYILMAGVHIMDYWLGSGKSPNNSFDQVIELLQKSIALEENNDGAYSLLCHVYALQRQFKKSIEAGKKAIDINPNSDSALVWLAMTLRWVGKPEEAIALHQQAIRLCPFPPSFYYLNLGHAYRSADRWEEAIEEYKKAQHLTPTNIFVFEGLSICYGLLGQENESRSAAMKILKLNPNYTTKLMAATNPYKDRQMVGRWADVLQRAGIPEYPPGTKPPDKPSIAVLAFDNLSGDPEQEYFIDGIAEDIITALSKTDKLLVIARNSTFTYKGKPVKIKQVAEELGVRYVLEGSVRKTQDRVRITAQLIDATTEHHLWAERYDRDLNDIFALQDEITFKIVTALQVKLTEGERGRMWSRRYKNLDARLKGMETNALWRKGTIEGHMRYGQVAQELIDITPESEVGYTSLGWHYWFLALIGKSPQESIATALKLAQKAHSLDENSPFPYALLSNLYTMKREYDKAIAAGERGVALLPNGSHNHCALGITLSYAGKFDEAISHFNRAIRLDPFPEYYYFVHLGRCYMHKGQYEEALTTTKKALRVNPSALDTHIVLASIYALLDRQEEASAEVIKVLDMYPEFSAITFTKAWSYKNQGDLQFRIDALLKAGFPE